jgi:hypothetical protein
MSGRSRSEAARQQEQLLEQQRQQQQAAAEARRRRRRRTIWIVVIVIILVVLIAVGIVVYYLYFRVAAAISGGGGTGGGTGGTALGGSCTQDSTCQSGLICSADVCTLPPGATCSKSSSCPAKYACLSGTCQGTPQAVCASNANCASPYTCQDMVCSEPTCSGTGASGCPNGGQCNGSACVGLLGGYCTSNANCAMPYICDTSTNECVVQGCTSTSCANAGSNGGCPVLMGNPSCALDANQPCVQDSQCASNPLGSPPFIEAQAICDSATGLCKLYGNQPCTIADSPTQCLDTCSAGGRCECSSAAQCNQLNDARVCDTSTNTCVVCASDADCPSGDVCVSNLCVPMCTTNADCTNPLRPSCGIDHNCIYCTADGQCPSNSCDVGTGVCS